MCSLQRARSISFKIDPTLIRELAWVISPLLIINVVWRAVDLIKQGGAPYLFLWRSETFYFWLEIVLFIVAPLVMLNTKRIMTSPTGIYWASAVVIMGFITNRINVSITAMERATQANYVPKWPEMAIVVMMITAAVIAFRYAVLYLDILPRRAKARTWLANAGVVANA